MVTAKTIDRTRGVIVPTVKKGYFLTRGKTHLTKDEELTYCGTKLEDVNSSTTEVPSVTCQKCLMAKTGTWRKPWQQGSLDGKSSKVAKSLSIGSSIIVETSRSSRSRQSSASQRGRLRKTSQRS